MTRAMQQPQPQNISKSDCVWHADAGAWVIDTHYIRPRYDASFLVASEGHAAFIECGTNHAVPRLLAALQQAGLSPDAVDYVIVTHVHLDHAGGAGKLMQALPNAKLVVHPRGARHMKDPEKLTQGAKVVYGEQAFAALYGDLVPVPEARVHEAADDELVQVGARRLQLLHTPGHARHHLAVWDPATRSMYTGDVFGIAFDEAPAAEGLFVLPSTSPIQFDPAEMRASIARIAALKPARVMLTHFGALNHVDAIAAALGRAVDGSVELCARFGDHPERHARLVEGLREVVWSEAQLQGCPMGRAELMELCQNDVEINAQGLEVYIEQEREARAAG
jgi:glyoxylase-like metal-dependent hydrolase (beta-lactamase superfamily II)